jgi:hypothetical protein
MGSEDALAEDSQAFRAEAESFFARGSEELGGQAGAESGNLVLGLVDIVQALSGVDTEISRKFEFRLWDGRIDGLGEELEAEKSAAFRSQQQSLLADEAGQLQLLGDSVAKLLELLNALASIDAQLSDWHNVGRTLLGSVHDRAKSVSEGSQHVSGGLGSEDALAEDSQTFVAKAESLLAGGLEELGGKAGAESGNLVLRLVDIGQALSGVDLEISGKLELGLGDGRVDRLGEELEAEKSAALRSQKQGLLANEARELQTLGDSVAKLLELLNALARIDAQLADGHNVGRALRGSVEGSEGSQLVSRGLGSEDALAEDNQTFVAKAESLLAGGLEELGGKLGAESGNLVLWLVDIGQAATHVDLEISGKLELGLGDGRVDRLGEELEAEESAALRSQKQGLVANEAGELQTLGDSLAKLSELLNALASIDAQLADGHNVGGALHGGVVNNSGEESQLVSRGLGSEDALAEDNQTFVAKAESLLAGGPEELGGKLGAESGNLVLWLVDIGQAATHVDLEISGKLDEDEADLLLEH